MRCASFCWSPVSREKNSRVPDLAMVPRFAITSSRLMRCVVGHREGARLAVVVDAYPQIGIVLEEGGVVQGLEAQLVAGVGSVGDELPQEDSRLEYSEWIMR